MPCGHSIIMISEHFVVATVYALYALELKFFQWASYYAIYALSMIVSSHISTQLYVGQSTGVLV